MIKFPIAWIVLFVPFFSHCQNGEFKTYENGLIYSPPAMAKLSRIVDSLNLKYSTCNLNPVFHSRYQVIGHLVEMKKGNFVEAQKDLNRNISFQEFRTKYPNAVVKKNILILKQKYRNYEDEEVVEFEQFDLKSDYGQSITSRNLALYQKNLAKSWVFEYNEKGSYSEESLYAFYFPEDFQSVRIPEKYARMIGYADCLIDTTTTKFMENSREGRPDLPANWKNLSYEEKSRLLKKFRSTRVIGGCSQDDGPRTHAVNIALLSAETYNWKVFLKAHLDIMNDRFERMSDGSYAWGKRNTYIKEVEELNIQVPDLILGISFQIENPARNHYFGSIGRIGRALAES
jgi:hypothetical protein